MAIQHIAKRTPCWGAVLWIGTVFRIGTVFWIATVFGIVALPASADWLITLEGKMIETEGPWTIEGDRLTYTDTEGEEHTLSVVDIDLEASEETTALRAGLPYEPEKRAAADSTASQQKAGKRQKKARGKGGNREEPVVILYMTTLCRQCTLARELLEELEVPFVAMDINKSKKAKRQNNKKAGHGGGLPVLDIGGSMVFSYNPRAIRQRVEQLKAKTADEQPERSHSENLPD